LIAATVLPLTSCTQLSPASVNDFGALKSLQVTLRDGETIRGRIQEGENVTFTTFGRVYRATVESVDGGNIVLTDVYVQEEYERFRIQRERMESSTLHLKDGTERITIPAYKIVQVEEVSLDRTKSGLAAAFWLFTGFVAAEIMGARF
jgi:small nuclear ribonucleoprotein (snRNP)-like protein